MKTLNLRLKEKKLGPGLEGPKTWGRSFYLRILDMQ
jgi:hypothetical protein